MESKTAQFVSALMVLSSYGWVFLWLPSKALSTLTCPSKSTYWRYWWWYIGICRDIYLLRSTINPHRSILSGNSPIDWFRSISGVKYGIKILINILLNPKNSHLLKVKIIYSMMTNQMHYFRLSKHLLWLHWTSCLSWCQYRNYKEH